MIDHITVAHVEAQDIPLLDATVIDRAAGLIGRSFARRDLLCAKWATAASEAHKVPLGPDRVHRRLLHAWYHRRPGVSLFGVGRVLSNVSPQPAEHGRPSFELRRPRRADMAGALALLRASGLVVDGVATNWDRFRVAVERDSQGVCGVAGLELHRGVAVVRSVAVDVRLRRRRLGARLVSSVIADAVRAGAQELYLTTTGSEAFYRSLGFERIGERDCQASALQVAAFRRACARGSTPMVLRAGDLSRGDTGARTNRAQVSEALALLSN